MHDIVLIFDGVPVFANALWLYRADITLFVFRNRVKNHLVVQSNHMVFALALNHTHLMLIFSRQEHPIGAEFVIEHLAEVR